MQAVEEPDDEQVEGNKKRGGGPKTPEGKATSRYNAQKHAILRETITKYEDVEAGQIYDELAEAIKPKGRVQELLVENIASNAIRLLRIARAEAEAVKGAMNPGGLDLARFDGGYKPIMKRMIVEELLLYSRYQTATENRLYHALKALKELQRDAEDI